MAVSPFNQFEIVDRTRDALIIPNTWSLTTDLGIFSNDSVTNATFIMEEIEQERGGVLRDSAYNVRSRVERNDKRQMRTFYVPHFGMDAYITPQDLVNKRAFGSDGQEELDMVRARKLGFIRRTIAETAEASAMHAIVTGTAFAPDATINVDWYTTFGKTRKVKFFDLANAATSINAKCEDVIATMQDDSQNGTVVPANLIALCSPDFFSALIAHNGVQTAWLNWTQLNPLLANRTVAGGLTLDARYRHIEMYGITFVEYRGGYYMDGVYTPYVPAGKAYVMPRGASSAFQKVYAPAQRFDTYGQAGQELYVREYLDERAQQWTLMAESNFLHVLREPNLIIELNKAAS
jgi:hypothetical protein